MFQSNTNCSIKSGGVVCRLTESSHRVSGLTFLHDTLYVLRCRDADQIELHVLDSGAAPARFSQLRSCISLPRLYRDDWNDVASSTRHGCLYVSNFSMDRIQRVDPRDSAVTLWSLPGAPCGLSITRDDNLLVTIHDSKRPGQVMEIDGGSGHCIRKLVFGDGVRWSWHTVEVPRSTVRQGQYLVSHGYYDRHDHGVTLVGAGDGRKFRSYGGIPGAPDVTTSNESRLCVPYHLAVAADGNVFVADHHNGRVLVLSAGLDFMDCFASQDDELSSRPRRLCLDGRSRLLCVGQDDGTVTAFQL